MDYFSMPVQFVTTGTFILLCLHTNRSLTRRRRRIQQNMAALAAMKKSLPAAIGNAVHQPLGGPQGAAISTSAAPDLRLALHNLQASFDAVMVKLDRIEALVDGLPCKPESCTRSTVVLKSPPL